jgi:hypothetical protein
MIISILGKTLSSQGLGTARIIWPAPVLLLMAARAVQWRSQSPREPQRLMFYPLRNCQKLKRDGRGIIPPSRSVRTLWSLDARQQT